MQKTTYYVDRSLSSPLYIQLYNLIKSNIHQQKIKYSEKLPSKRKLAQALQISQSTIENTYSQLVTEGYVEARAKKGYFVCFQSNLFLQPRTSLPKPIAKPTTVQLTDLNPNHIDTLEFPLTVWHKLYKYAAYTDKQLLVLGDKQGELALRSQIVEYLYASRGISCNVEQIFIDSGIENLIYKLHLFFTEYFRRPQLKIALETNGYTTVKNLMQRFGHQCNEIAIHNNSQLIEQLIEQSINLFYLSPSNLPPFKDIMSISQRQDLLLWTTTNQHSYLIEDDFDSEFRYHSKPIPALQSLDRASRVIYLGSFSKLLTPALRITFMVLPNRLTSHYQQLCQFFNCSVSRLDQQSLANFMRAGYFEKHIHKMRNLYKKKMDLIVNLLAEQPPKLYGQQHGTSILVELLNQRQIKQLHNLAQQQKLKFHFTRHHNNYYLNLGFANLSSSKITQLMPLIKTALAN